MRRCPRTFGSTSTCAGPRRSPTCGWSTRRGDQREGLELDRNQRNARWVVDRGAGIETPLARWFYPEQPAPFAAEFLWLIGRSAVAGYALALAALGLSALVRWVRHGLRWSRVRVG